MDHDISILKAQKRMLSSDNFLLQQQIHKKELEILLLKRKIRKLELQLPKKCSSYQLSLSDFVD